MIILQSIPEFQAHLPHFSIEDNFQVVYNQFLGSSLGKIYQAIPWDELVDCFGITESKVGPDCIFTPTRQTRADVPEELYLLFRRTLS